MIELSWQLVGILATVVIATLAWYELVMLRPSLILEFEPSDSHFSIPTADDTLLLNPAFYLFNTGREVGKEPHVKIELIGCNFDATDVSIEPEGEPMDGGNQTIPEENTPDVDIEDEVPDARQMFEPEARYGFMGAKYFEERYEFPPAVAGPGIIIDRKNRDYSHKKEDPEYPITDLQLLTEQVDCRIGKPGEIRTLISDTPIYPKSRFKIYFGSLSLPVGYEYKIEYEVACHGHSPRQGTIRLEAHEDGLEYNSEHPDSFNTRVEKNLESIKMVAREGISTVDKRIWNVDKLPQELN